MNQNNTSNVADEPTDGGDDERNNNRESFDGSTNVGSGYRVSFGAGEQDENITNTNNDDESTNTPTDTVNQQQQDKIAALTEALMAVLNHSNDGSTVRVQIL